MPSPSLLDFDSLLAPIPGDDPAGEDLPFDVRQKLDEYRQEIDNPDQPEASKKPDWAGVVRLAQDTLTKTSKHLRPAARLTEALVKLHGFAGLRDGVRVMRRLIEDCWDRMRPTLTEPDDLERRAADLHWLDDAERAARFPYTVRFVPVFGVTPELSLFDMQRARDGQGSMSWDDFQKVIRESRLSSFQTFTEDLEETLAEMDLLGKAMSAKMQSAAPAMVGLRGAVGECYTLMKQINTQYNPVAAAAQGGQEAAESGQSSDGVSGQIRSREQAYRQLAAAAATLRQLEPHSPIPYLVDRCISLGSLPFPELMRELVRDSGVLEELNRLMGIKEAAE
jgi:type VI secretion system protein ImpA